MKGPTFILALTIVISWSVVASGEGLDCPQPLRQVDQNIKGDAEGKAQTLLKVGELQFKGQVETSVVNLFEKYPNADRVAVLQNFQSIFCNLVKSSNLSDESKFDKLFKLIELLTKYLPSGEKLSQVPRFEAKIYNGDIQISNIGANADNVSFSTDAFLYFSIIPKDCHNSADWLRLFGKSSSVYVKLPLFFGTQTDQARTLGLSHWTDSVDRLVSEVYDYAPDGCIDVNTTVLAQVRYDSELMKDKTVSWYIKIDNSWPCRHLQYFQYNCNNDDRRRGLVYAMNAGNDQIQKINQEAYNNQKPNTKSIIPTVILSIDSNISAIQIINAGR